ncbi:hypothetical protein LINPERPRIM_LOCUS8188 [Linum perenne]
MEMGRGKIMLGVREGDKTYTSAVLFDVLIIAVVGRRRGGRGEVLITAAAAAACALARFNILYFSPV